MTEKKNYDFTVSFTGPSVFPTKKLEEQWVEALQPWVDEDKAKRFFTNEVKAEFLEWMWYWCRDFNKPPEVLEEFTRELAPDRYFMTIHNKILRELISKFVYFMEAPINYFGGCDSRQRHEFMDWVEKTTGEDTGLGFNPYKNEMHQIWWYAWEQALIIRYY